jgi:hypothetical protein
MSASKAITSAIQILNDELVANTGFATKGTVVKAFKGNGRFDKKSVWVSMGNGKYLHLTGKKGLIAKADRLAGYVNVIFAP